MELREMEFGAVTFVLAEAILRKARAKVTHDSVARHLCDHARGRDRLANAIAIDDRSLGQGKRKYRQPVDERMMRRGQERGDRDFHRFVRRAQNINPVDFGMINNSGRPPHIGVRSKIDIDLFAQFGGELFGIIQFPVPEFLGKNHGRSHHRPGQRAPPRFINAGNMDDACCPKFVFVTKSATPGHHGKSFPICSE
jgi:hypothetical protein